MKLTANQVLSPVSPQQADKGGWTQFLRIMKLTTIIILAACLHVSAKGIAQQTITFSGKEVNLENVFNAIKKQTNYRFFFNTDMLKNASKVTIEVKNAQIEQVMNLALKDQPLTFAIKGRTIFIMKKPEEEKKSVQVASPTGDPITVSGRVTDDQGQPLVGASVRVKGSSSGATTDAQGRFTLNNVDPNATLEVSFVGHETQLLAVKGKTVFSVALGQRIGELDETVVIAYGTTTKRFATGNISSVKSADIEKQPVNNPLLALQGRVPGLFITQANGLPGGGVTVRIQGQNSLAKGNDPFYVIDGVPYIFQLQNSGIDGILGRSGSGVPGYGAGNPLNYINPSDIESIEILKDADATAIYGSRAANGAILITTKKGKPGKVKVDLNLQQGWGKVTRRLDMMNTSQYLEMRHEALGNDGLSPSSSDYDLNGLWDTTRSTDWQKILIGGISQYTNVNASVSGGNELTQYLIGSTYHRETTVFPGSFADKKSSLHFSIENTSANRRFSVRLSGNYMVDNNFLPHQDLTQPALLLEPVAPALYSLDGTLNWAPDASGNSTLYNPLVYLYQTYKNKTKNLISNLTLKYELLPSLHLLTSFGYTDIQINDYTSTPLIAIDPVARPYTQRTASFVARGVNTWIVEPQMTYQRTVGKGKLDFLIGTTIQQNKSDNTSISGEGYNSDAVLESISAATTIHAGNSKAAYKYNALFGRVNYTWMSKYIVNLTARRDGSSRFGPKNRFQNFGSAGLAWIFSQEGFLKDIKILSFGKIKASYGSTGNDQIGDYAYMNLYSPYYQGVPYQGIGAVATFTVPNPYLEWEETRKLQIGTDLGFLSDRILITATYARNRSSNQLVPYRLPNITGFTIVTQNFPATVQNINWEFSLQTSNIKSSSFTWSSNINLTIPKNKLVEFPGLERSAFASSLVIGKPISVIKAIPLIGVDEASGEYKYIDSKGASTFTPNTSTDRTALVDPTPKFYGGFQNTLRYKGFELDFLFQFTKQTANNSLAFYNGSLYPGQFFQGYSNQPQSVLDHWRKSGDKASVAKYTTTPSDSYYYISGTDRFYVDASYIRLKNLSLSYDLPINWQRKIHVSNCRIYLHGQNFWTLTNYKGLDPENQSYSSLPPLKIWTFGVQLRL